MVRKDILTRRRANNSMTFSLTDGAKLDAQALLQNGELKGLMLAVVDDVAPEGA